MKSRFFRFIAGVTLLSLGGLAAPRVASADKVIGDSHAGYSSTQGLNGWYYGYYTTPGDSSSFTQFTIFNAAHQWVESATPPPYTALSQDRAVPSAHWAVRRFVSPKAGKVILTGTLAKTDTSAAGDGVIGHIYYNGTEVYNQFIAATDGTGVQFSVTLPYVSIGDTIDFALDPNGNNSNDATTFIATAKQAVAKPHDFNADGNADVLLQNQTSGALLAWYMNGDIRLGGDYLQYAMNPYQDVVGSADFNDDGRNDLVLQNPVTGQLAIWFYNGISRIGVSYIAGGAPPGWDLVGTPDIDGDGKADLLWQKRGSNNITAWIMDGTTVTRTMSIFPTPALAGQNPSADWRVVGNGDFDGDGSTDLVFQNTNPSSSQYNYAIVWFLKNGVFDHGAYVYPRIPAGYRVAGAANLSNDDKVDLLLQNDAQNKLAVWYMNGLTLDHGVYVKTPVPAGWEAVGLR